MILAETLLSVFFGAEPGMCADLEPVEPIFSLENVMCDDRSYLIDSAGKLNARCVLEGCTLYDEYCWDYRLEHCYDDGILNGECTTKSTDCTTPGGCLWLWAWCDGVWECAEGGISSGWCTCVTEDE
jgi:hypothetical protein